MGYPQLIEAGSGAPSIAPAMFTQAVCHPRYVTHANGQIGPSPPETGDMMPAVQFARFPHTHHCARARGT